METSRYENVAQSFLDAHPRGTAVTANKLQTWVAENPDGAAIKPDLAIEDPVKRVATIRRHLNEGGRSENVAEERRFQIEVEDAKRQIYTIRSYADLVTDQARGALNKSVMGAVNPLNRSKKAMEAIKVDELPDIERQAFETARENLLAMEATVKPTMQQEIQRIWVADMARRGISAEQAKALLGEVQHVKTIQKLLQATS